MSDTDDGRRARTSSEGQVSELAPEDAAEPISSGDSVAGQPDPHPGEVDEGAQGPNARDPTASTPTEPDDATRAT